MRRSTAIGVGVAVVVMAVAVAVTLWLSHRSGGAPDSPRAAAQAWADAYFHHDAAKERSVVCAGQLQSLDSQMETIKLTAPVISGYRATGVRPSGSGRWQVSLAVEPGGTTFSVVVVKRDGHYLVCE